MNVVSEDMTEEQDIKNNSDRWTPSEKENCKKEKNFWKRTHEEMRSDFQTWTKKLWKSFGAV